MAWGRLLQTLRRNLLQDVYKRQLVLFAAVTSSIALTESAVSTFEDELGWERKQATVLIGIIMLVLFAAITSSIALTESAVSTFEAVSYTHLDVYKRQSICCPATIRVPPTIPT